jgi:hypothetical protein
MRLPRMTTRRWMIAVAVAAILAAVLIEVGKAWKLHARYVSALGAFQTSRAYYGEGRVLLETCVRRSQHLMEAQLALCATWEERVAAINCCGEGISP